MNVVGKEKKSSPLKAASQLVRRAGAAGVRVALHAPARGARLPPYGDHREGVLLDLACPHHALVLETATASRAFNLRHSWLLLAGGNASALRRRLRGAGVLADADAVALAGGALLDVYRAAAQRPLRLTALPPPPPPLLRATRRQLERLWARVPPAATRRRDLGGITVRAAVVLTQPQHFRGWGRVHARHIDTYPKLTHPLLVHCAEDLHFRLDMRQVQLYGEERNGSFDGLAGLLQRGAVELGVASMFMRADRWRVLHFCSETVVVRGVFLFRRPARSAVSNVFALAFSGGVWAALAAAAAAAAALLALAGALHRRLRPGDPGLAALTPPEACTFVIGAFCQQGWHLCPRAASARAAALSALLASLFAFTSYSANILALLQAPGAPLRSLADLAASPMDVAVQDTTYRRVYFAESEDPATQRLYRRKLLPLGERAFLGVEEGVARVRAGLFAFQVEESPGYDIVSKTFTESEKCSLAQIQAFTLPTPAVPLRRHSGLRDLLAARLRWQREVGIVSRYARVWTAARARCGAGGARAPRVGLRDVAPAAQLLLAGALLAALVLLAERAHRACTRPRHSPAGPPARPGAELTLR